MPRKFEQPRTGKQPFSEAEERDFHIRGAFSETDDKEARERVLEKRSKTPRNKKSILEYENKPQRVSRGKMLKYLRGNLNLTQTEMALLVGTNRSYYAQAERGIVNISCGALDLWCQRAGGRLMIIPF